MQCITEAVGIPDGGSAPATRTLQLCYRLLQHSVRDYRQNELFASSWMGMIIDHACRTTKANTVLAEDALQVCLSFFVRDARAVSPLPLRGGASVCEPHECRGDALITVGSAQSLLVVNSGVRAHFAVSP